MSGMGGSFSKSKSRSDSGVQFYDGQQEALGGIFAPGGIFDQFLSGKPNAGFERQQNIGLQQLQRQQAAQGLLNTPLGTRAQDDYLRQTTQMAGDNWLESLFQFMQPAGQKSRSRAKSISMSGQTG